MQVVAEVGASCLRAIRQAVQEAVPGQWGVTPIPKVKQPVAVAVADGVQLAELLHFLSQRQAQEEGQLR